MSRGFFSAYDQEARRFHHWSPSLLKEFADCQRYAYYKRIRRLPVPEFAPQVLGTRMHRQQEHLVRTGEDVFEERLRGLRKFFPAVLPAPGVRAEFGLDGKERVEGIPYDYARAVITLLGRPVEGYMDLREPGRVSDLKTTSDISKWARTPKQLRRDIQMGTYARALLEWEPALPEVRVRHLYAQTKGPVRCEEVPATLSLDDVRAVVDDATRLAEGLVALEGVDDDSQIPRTGEPKGLCHKFYGRRCPFFGACHQEPLSALRARVDGQRNEFRGSASEQTIGGSVGLFDRLKAAAQNQGSGVAGVQAPAPVAPGGVPPSPSPGAAASLPAPPPSAVPPAPSNSSPGQSAMAGWKEATCETCKQVVGLRPPGHRVAAHDGCPGAPKVMQIQDAPPEPLSVAPPEVKKRGRSKKDFLPAAGGAAAAAAEPASPAPAPGASGATQVKAETEGGAVGKLPIRLYVNALPPQEEFSRAVYLDAYAAEKAAAVAGALQVQDYRLAAYGAGKGGLAALVREEPPPPGVYVAFPSTDGPLQVVVDALLPLVAFSVRGVR